MDIQEDLYYLIPDNMNLVNMENIDYYKYKNIRLLMNFQNTMDFYNYHFHTYNILFFYHYYLYLKSPFLYITIKIKLMLQ